MEEIKLHNLHNTHGYGICLNIPNLEELISRFEHECADFKTEVYIQIGDFKREMTFDEFLDALGVKR